MVCCILSIDFSVFFKLHCVLKFSGEDAIVSSISTLAIFIIGFFLLGGSVEGFSQKVVVNFLCPFLCPFLVGSGFKEESNSQNDGYANCPNTDFSNFRFFCRFAFFFTFLIFNPSLFELLLKTFLFGKLFFLPLCFRLFPFSLCLLKSFRILQVGIIGFCSVAAGTGFFILVIKRAAGADP